MINFNIQGILKDMLNAFEVSLKADGGKLVPELQKAAKQELLAIAKRIEEISRMVIKSEVDKEQAKILFNMQKEAAEEQLLTIEGITKVLVQNAINAALGAVRNTVNKAIGWLLL
jgi:hypothetical protein